MDNKKLMRIGGSSWSLKSAKGRLKPEKRGVTASKPKMPPSATPLARPEVAGMVPPMDRPMMPPQEAPVPPMMGQDAPSRPFMGPPQIVSPMQRTQPSRSPAGAGIIENAIQQPRKL